MSAPHAQQHSLSPKNENIYLLDFGAGNVLSILNSLKEIGVEPLEIKHVDDFKAAKVRIGKKEDLKVCRKLYFLWSDPLERQWKD